MFKLKSFSFLVIYREFDHNIDHGCRGWEVGNDPIQASF